MRSARGRLWSAAGLVVALAMSATGLLPAAHADGPWDPDEPTPLSAPGMAVSLAQSGELALWGGDEYGQTTGPAAMAGTAFSQVILPAGATLGLTADGRVLSWGANADRLEKVPAEVTAAKVAQITTSQRWAGAVTRDGRVFMWGFKQAFQNPLSVPAGLNDVTQLAIGTIAAMALKRDGSVVAWGRNQAPLTPLDVPEGLKATAILAVGSAFFALTDEGTVTCWGWEEGSSTNTACNQLPASVTEPGNVKAITGSDYNGGLALLADNTVVPFGAGGTVPAELQGVDTVLLGSGGVSNEYAFLDRSRTIHHWSTGGVLNDFPAEWNGRDITQIALCNCSTSIDIHPAGGAIIAKMLRADLPTVSGSSRVGSTLTGVAGTFSDDPDDVTSQWLADGVPISGATGETLTVTNALAGKAITYESTATKSGQDTISSSSDPVTVPRNAVLSVAAAKASYGKSSAVSVTVTGATGKVTATLDGKSMGTKTLAGGKASFAVPKATKPGKHTLKASYAGSASVSAGAKTATLTVAKGATGKPVLKVKKASHKKKGTVTVTIKTAAGLTKATGKAQLVLKKGKGTKKVSLTVKKGKATGKLPKLPKGTWKATVTYKGNGYYVSMKSKTVKVKSK